MRAEEMLAIVRILDGALNNTSLILLFEVGGKRLLFPGDAQIENWSYALHAAPNSEEIRERLAERRLLQGRPPRQPERDAEDAVGALRAPRAPGSAGSARDDGLHAAGKHGSVDRGTEVPRTDADRRARGARATCTTRRTSAARKTFWNDVEFEL